MSASRSSSTVCSRSRTRNEMWSSRISGIGSPFSRCGAQPAELELAVALRVDRVERGGLLGARRRRLARIVDEQLEGGGGDDGFDVLARMDAREPRAAGAERDHAAVGDELRRAERAVAGALDPSAGGGAEADRSRQRARFMGGVVEDD